LEFVRQPTDRNMYGLICIPAGSEALTIKLWDLVDDGSRSCF